MFNYETQFSAKVYHSHIVGKNYTIIVYQGSLLSKGVERKSVGLSPPSKKKWYID
jgi:hypothetical protein